MPTNTATPSTIENDLKFSPYIVDAMLVGDGRKYLTCLVMIDRDKVRERLAKVISDDDLRRYIL